MKGKSRAFLLPKLLCRQSSVGYSLPVAARKVCELAFLSLS